MPHSKIIRLLSNSFIYYRPINMISDRAKVLYRLLRHENFMDTHTIPKLDVRVNRVIVPPNIFYPHIFTSWICGFQNFFLLEIEYIKPIHILLSRTLTHPANILILLHRRNKCVRLSKCQIH